MKVLPFAVIVAFCAGAPSLARADDIGRVKVAKGQVSIERAGAAVAAGVGTRLQSADVVTTGVDSSVGITMNDD